MLLMEIWAITYGLNAIAFRGLCSIILEFDSLIAVRLLEKEVDMTIIRFFVEEILEVSRARLGVNLDI